MTSLLEKGVVLTLMWSERNPWLHCHLSRRHLVLGELLELRQQAWVCGRLTHLLAHGGDRVTKLTQGHRVAKAHVMATHA